MMPSHKALSDEDLMDRYYAGDDEAFAILEERYTPRLIRFFWTLDIRPREECEDCTQETWQRVARTRYQPSSRFDRSRTRFATWLFAIAHHVAHDYWRRQRTRPQTVSPPQNADGGDDWDALGHVVTQDATLSAQSEVRKDFHDCISLLEEPWRSVVLLRLAGCTFEQVTEHTGGVVSTAKNRECGAIARLRTCLEAKGHAVRAG